MHYNKQAMTKYIFTLLFSLGGLLILLGYNEPDGNNIAIYLAVFSLIYIICLQIIYITVRIAYPKISKSNKLFISIVMAFSPIALLALSTLGSMKVIDVLLSIGIPLIIIWYGIKQQRIR
jgi:hypothetical protein